MSKRYIIMISIILALLITTIASNIYVLYKIEYISNEMIEHDKKMNENREHIEKQIEEFENNHNTSEEE